MTLYSDCAYPIDAELEDLHADELASFAAAGTWWSARERLAIAAEARTARVADGVQASIGDEHRAAEADLPEAVRDLAQRAALGGMSINRRYFDDTLKAGVSDAAYVEVVGVVARVAHLDVFARGVGVDPRAIPEADESSVPTRARPTEAVDEGYFAHSVPDGEAGGETGKRIYRDGGGANILRSLSLVPDEAYRLNKLISQEYMTSENMGHMTYSSQAALSRAQLELVAAKVSALNQCFY